MIKDTFTLNETKLYADYMFERHVPEAWLRDYFKNKEDTESVLILLDKREQEILNSIAANVRFHNSEQEDLMEELQSVMEEVTKTENKEMYILPDGAVIETVPGGKYLLLNADTTLGELSNWVGEDKALDILMNTWFD